VTAERRPSPEPGTGAPDPHYSYRVYADPGMADRFDAMRFSGPIGTLLADTQERVLAEFLGPMDGKTVLDVGTGTGRAAIALARAWRVRGPSTLAWR
jgi:ubiquinone/menaquinone biosynthesis C-methylase UbiE